MDEGLRELIFLLAPTLGLVVAIAALLYSHRGDRRKTGTEIRGSCAVAWSAYSEDQYISSVTLQNLKDRPVAIFAIYLEIGHGYYLEIEKFEKSPLILDAFGIYRNDYGLVDLYSSNMVRAQLPNLMGPDAPRQRIVLSTSSGRYSVRVPIGQWEPTWERRRNTKAGLAIPIRSEFAGKEFGSKTKYVVRMRMANGQEKLTPIYSWEGEKQFVREFKFTPESLQSKNTLEKYLREEAKRMELPVSEISVFDLDAWRKARYGKMLGFKLEVKPQGWFAYHVAGRLMTYRRNLWPRWMLWRRRKTPH